MIVTKNLGIKKFFQWGWPIMLLLMLFSSLMTALFHFKIITISLPWIAISVIGTAVAFYLGFKNNQAYDRMWEARKIWGGIVNDSRTWGMMVDGYVSNLHNENTRSPEQIASIKKRLVYRHIAWLYAHRSQLLVPTPWEHVSQGGFTAKNASYYQNKFGVGLVDDEVTKVELLLLPEEHDRLVGAVNTATQIINEQSRDLAQLRKNGLIDDFRHMEMGNLLKSFYTLQGKNERIKKFPLPRQYANMSQYFVTIFILLLPFGLIPEILKLGNWGVWLSTPVIAVISWIYFMMDSVGDFTENPFQGMANDIPMLSLCRTIEIDMRQMLNETDLPPAIKAKDGILM
ncbi:MAG: bestrophin family protein [Crocinitomicaceae bacterium]